MDPVAVETVAGAKAVDLILHLSLAALEPAELAVLLGAHSSRPQGSITELQALVVGPRHVVRPALGREVAVASERAEPVARVVLAHDEEAILLLDDGEAVAHRRRPPTVTTTSSPRTSTG